MPKTGAFKACVMKFLGLKIQSNRVRAIQLPFSQTPLILLCNRELIFFRILNLGAVFHPLKVSAIKTEINLDVKASKQQQIYVTKSTYAYSSNVLFRTIRMFQIS